MTPHELADEKLAISAEYEYLSEQLVQIDQKRPYVWISLKENSKSDKEATMKWDISEEGQDEIRIRSRLKAIDKRTSAISSMLRVLEAEARNQI